MGEQIVELGGALADQVGEDLALLLARADRGRARARSDKIAAYRENVGSTSSGRYCFRFDLSIARRLRHVKALLWGLYLAGALRMAARAGLLITTVPSMMSCSSRRRSLKKATSKTNGVKKETVNQNAMACTAPSTK